jgi:hypothetical protein
MSRASVPRSTIVNDVSAELRSEALSPAGNSRVKRLSQVLVPACDDWTPLRELDHELLPEPPGGLFCTETFSNAWEKNDILWCYETIGAL